MKQRKQLLNPLGLHSPHLSQHLLRLLLLLVTAIGGASSSWADELCSAYLTNTAGNPNVTNCTLNFYGDEGSLATVPAGTQYSESSYYYKKIDNDKNYYVVKLNSGSFSAGNTITVYLYADAATQVCKIGKTSQHELSASNAADSGVYGLEYELTAEDIEEDGSLRIYRYSSKTWFAGVKVAGDVPPTPSPTITISTQPVGGTYTQFTTVNPLTVVASASNSAALTYRWQSASSENGSYSNISGATNASYQVANTSTSNTWYKCIVSAEGCGNEETTPVNVIVEGGNKGTGDLTKITENYIYTPNAAIPVGTLTADGKILSPAGGCNYNSSGLNIKNNRYIALSVAAGASLSVTAQNHTTKADEAPRILYISKTSNGTDNSLSLAKDEGAKTLTVENTEDAIYYIWASSDIYIKNIDISFGPSLYTVNYSNDSEKGNCTATSFTQTSAGEGTTLPGATPKPGYTFHGWDTNGDGTADAHTEDTFTPAQDITLTAIYSNGNVVGDANEGWWTAFSNFVTLPKNNSIHLTFNNQSHGTATYNNWAMVVTSNTNGHNGDGVQSGTGNELYFIRPNGESLDRSHNWALYKENAGHYNKIGYKEGEETSAVSDAEWSNFKTAMANADVDIQVSFDGTSIYTIAKTSASNGTKYILVDKSTNNSTNYENVYVSFTVDKCVLTFNTQNDATPSVTVNVHENVDAYGDVAAKIASGIQLASDRPIWAGTEVEFQASANTGYTFVNWTDNNNDNEVVSTESYLKQTVSANVNWTANFAESYAYTVNAVDESSNVLKEIKTDNVIANTEVTVYYPAYILKEGVMYKINTNPSHPDYGKTFSVDENNKVVNLTYTAQAIENVVAYFEGEELPGASSAALTAVSSNGYLGRYPDGNYHQIMTLNQGKYKIHGYARNGNGSDFPYSFNAASTEVFAGSILKSNIFQSMESSEFIVENDNTPLSLQLAGGSAAGIDFLYIVRTGDYTPVQENKVNITFTTEDKKAVAVVSTPNYGVTASVANGNMTPDGTALKIETSTQVTVTIPEGYTANMKFTASNNGGINVTNVGTSETYNGSTSAVRENLPAGTYTITKGNSLNVSMITLELTPLSTDVAALTSVTSSASNVEVTPAGNNVWGVVVPADYVGSTVPVTLNYEHATTFTVKQNEIAQTPTASGEGTATFDFNIGTQIAPVSYTVTTGNNAGSQTYTINVLKLGQEYDKKINVTDFNYYVGTSGIAANDNGLDRNLNGVNFTFTGGQGVKVNSENLITVRRRSDIDGTVTIALNGSNTGAHITKIVLGGSGFTAEAANYLTMTDGQITFRNSNELMVVPTTLTNTVTFMSNGTDVNITSFTIYTDAALSFTKVTPTATINGIADNILVNSTVTPTLTTTPKNFKVSWTYVTNKSNSTIDANSGIIAVGGKTSTTDKVRAKFAGNDFYNQLSVDKSFNTVKASAPTITIAAGFEDGVTPSGTFAVTLATSTSATIYYTTDDTEPTTSSPQYSVPFNISTTTTVKAIAVYNISGTEIISDLTTKRFNYLDPSLYKQKYVDKITDSNASDFGLVKTATVVPAGKSYTNYNMTDKMLQCGGQDACVLSWGSYTYSSPNSSNGNKIDGTVRGTYSSLTEQPGKTQAIDGYVNTISTNNNPRSEAGAGYNDACAKGNDPLNLPVLGSFARLQPLYNGTVTVWLLQNGSSDWHYYDDIDEKNGRIPDGSAKSDESYQLDKLRRRPTYICDEFGTALSNGEDGNTAVVHATLANDAKFEPKTFNAIASAVYGTKTSSQYKAEEADLYDNETNVSTLPTDYSSQAIIDYWQNLIKARGWTAGGRMNFHGDNNGLVLTPNNGFELMIKQYVKYTFPVIAGKSYYVVGSGTNNSFCAAQFERSNDDVAVGAAPIVISETAEDFSNITNNIGQQVNVQLNRTFTENKWYSLVLPFSMNDVKVKEYFGDDAAIYWFDSTDDAGNIHWVKHHYQMINAGIPVLIKVTKNFTSGSQIKNVLIQTDKIREYSYGGDYVMTGSWTKTTMPENCYYISNTASSNPGSKTYEATIYRSAKATATNGLRAWVRPTSANAKRLTGISFASFGGTELDDDAATGISEILEGADEIVTSAISNGAIYNINGQRIANDNINKLPKGIYVQNGKKFIKK